MCVSIWIAFREKFEKNNIGIDLEKQTINIADDAVYALPPLSIYGSDKRHFEIVNII